MGNDLRVNVGGNISGFQASLESARAQARKFSNDLSQEVGGSYREAFNPSAIIGGITGALGFEAIKGHIEKLFEKAGQITDMSEQFDISTDSVQRWEKAVGRAGITFTTFTRALEALRAKQQSAREGESNAIKQFRAVGISEEDARTANPEELLKRVLTSDAERAQMADLITARGVRLRAAMNFMGNGEVPFSTGDLESLHQSEQGWANIKGIIQRQSLQTGAGRAMIAVSQLLNGEFRAGSRSALEALGGLGGPFGLFGDALKIFQGKNTVSPSGAPSEGRATKDPEYALKLKLREQAVERDIANEQMRQFDTETKMHALQRQRMSTAEQQKSILEDMDRIQRQVEAIDALEPGLRDSLKPRKDALLLEYQALYNQTAEKPMTFTPDSLARVGLFTSASASFNPVLGVQQQQLDVLRSIDRKIASDPYSP